MNTLLVRFTRPIAFIGILALNACTDQGTPLEPKTLIPSEASRLTVPAIGAYTQITNGICAVRNDGVVRCWANGQVTLEKTAAAGVFTLVKKESFHSCALRSDGAVECWGDNSDGKAPPVVTPPSGMLFVDLALGAFYTCALRNDGVIQCWGNNRTGEAPPTRAASSGLFVAVKANTNNTCGLTNFGVVECFGNSGEFTWSASTGSFTKLLGVGVTMCGIRTGGVVECRQTVNSQHVPMVGAFIDYAYSTDGDCGINLAGVALCSGTDPNEPPATIPASSGSFTQIVIGSWYACALRTDGGIDCWGLLAHLGAFEQVLPTATFTAPVSVIVGQPVSLSLTNAQVPGYPQATTFKYAFDCGDGSFTPSVPGNASTAACPTSTTGTRVVRGKVVDQGFSESIYSATVIVKNAQQATTDLLAEVRLAPLAPDIRKALSTKLDAALSAIAKGKTSAACTALRDFINQVNAQRGKAIPTTMADSWILTAQQLQATIGC